MSEFLSFTIAGIVTGSVYSVAATGLVVTYTTSGIFNIAHGAIGMVMAFLYWQLRVDWGVPAPVALILVVFVLAPLFGAMTERGVNAMLQPSVKLGADASLTVGPVGAGAGVATENLSVDLVAFSRSKGLYGGVSLQGAVLGVRSAWNQTYYGKPLTTRDILIRGEVNPRAAGFLAAVTKVAGPKRSAHRAE